MLGATINKLLNAVSVTVGEWSPSPELAFPAIACRLHPPPANAVRPSSLQNVALKYSFPSNKLTEKETLYCSIILDFLMYILLPDLVTYP